MTALAQPGNNVSFPSGSNSGGASDWLPYSPIMQGATENPVVTFTTQLGRFLLLGSVCLFNFTLVSSTMTKTTLTDVVRVTLPLAAQTLAGQVQQFVARVENATAVANMNLGEIASAAAFATFRNYTLAASSSQLTYGVATPGIGVLTNAITLNGSGAYDYANI